MVANGFTEQSSLVWFIYACVVQRIFSVIFAWSYVEFGIVIFCVNCEIAKSEKRVLNYVICALVLSGTSLKPKFSVTEIARGWSSSPQKLSLSVRNVLKIKIILRHCRSKQLVDSFLRQEICKAAYPKRQMRWVSKPEVVRGDHTSRQFRAREGGNVHFLDWSFQNNSNPYHRRYSVEPSNSLPFITIKGPNNISNKTTSLFIYIRSLQLASDTTLSLKSWLKVSHHSCIYNVCIKDSTHFKELQFFPLKIKVFKYNVELLIGYWRLSRGERWLCRGEYVPAFSR